MTKQWFVLHTLTGQEQKVKRYVEAQARLRAMTEYIGDVIIPTEKVSETRNGIKTTVTRKFFPGYVLASLMLYDDSRQILEPTWRFLRETPGVIGFVGGERPVPLATAEVDAIVNQAEAKKEKVRPKVTFEPGETVKITDGPFLNFTGTVDTVDQDRGKMQVSVAIFGRSVLVELECWQVERAAATT